MTTESGPWRVSAARAGSERGRGRGLVAIALAACLCGCYASNVVARTDRAIVFHIRDPGPGFDRTHLAHAAKASDPDSVMSAMEKRETDGLRSGGFGMLIVRQIVDEMVYNERGNEVLLIKHLK